MAPRRRRWQPPEGLRVHPDGTWRVGDVHVIHPPSLRYFKSHLVFEETGAFIVDGEQRMAVDVAGPAFQVTTLVLDADQQEARVVLDDGTVETVANDAIGMNRETGRFEARVRGGRAAALLARGPHQTLLEHMEEVQGRFFLRVGEGRIAVRT
jgi:hypothetical protein